MATFKVRRTATLQGGIKVGADGDTVSELHFGSGTLNSPCAASAAIVVASMAAANVDAGAMVFVLSASAGSGMVVQSASITGAGTLSASLYNAGNASAASAPVTLQWLAVS